MKKNIFIFTSLLFLYSICLANDGSKIAKQQAKQWIQNKSVQFLENKGQIADMSGNAVPFVLFKSSFPGMDMYITEKGLTYVFINAKENEERNKFILKRNKKKRISDDDDDVQLEWSRIDMKLKDANIQKKNIITEGESSDFSQYFFPHCRNGISNVHSYQKIIIKNIYPKIDWVLYGSGTKGFKYDFIIYPGADPKQIQLVYSSLKPLRINSGGEIEILNGTDASLHEQAPYTYIKETDQEVESKYQIISNQKIKDHYEAAVIFQLSNIPQKQSIAQTLVIDPQLVWSTFYGGTGFDGPLSITNDPSGNIFVTGYQGNGGFPVLNPAGGAAYFQGTFGGGSYDIFIFKFNNAGVPLWATYYGGSGTENGNSICTDQSGNIFVTGYTFSDNLPLRDPGAVYFQNSRAGGSDAFILKFNSSDSLIWATYYGGTGDDYPHCICADPAGKIILTGDTESGDLPLLNLAGAYNQPIHGGGVSDIFISKFSNDGAQLWSTYYGGDGFDQGLSVCADLSGTIYITGNTQSTNFPVANFAGAYNIGSDIGGSDVYISKFNASGALLWATYFGGSDYDYGYGICTDSNGNVFVMGNTISTDFSVFNPLGGAYYQPANTGSNEIFITKFSNAGALLWSTYYGGSGNESLGSYDNIVIDPCNNVYVSFNTNSTNIPVQRNCGNGFYDSTLTGSSDIFITKFNNSGSLLWATYFGGDGGDFREAMTVDNSGNLFISGEWKELTTNVSYPLTNPGGGAFYNPTFTGGDDGYIAKFIPSVISSNVTSTNACGCFGKASVNVSGGCLQHLYTWYNSNWTTIGNVQTITNLCSGNYRVIIKDTANCEKKDTAFVTINAGTIVTAFITGIDSICIGQSTTLVAHGGGTYQWNTNATDSTITVSPTNDTTYTVIVSNGSCFDTVSIHVVVKPAPIANFTASPITGSSPLPVNFINNSLNANTYSWLFGDGNMSSAFNTGNTYIASGTYTVLLIASNNAQCPDTAFATIIVDDNFTLQIPNVYTPNDDNINDLFKITTSGVKELNVEIYNRWGLKLVEWNGTNYGWDGYDTSGVKCADGTYYYIINATGFDEKEHIEKGAFMLIRK